MVSWATDKMLAGKTIYYQLNNNYYLPMNISGFKFAVNMHAQRTFGYPSKEGGATDFIYLGLLINTPLKF